MTKTHLTFEDLLEYISTADRDPVGMHYPWANKSKQIYPIYSFHIYDGRTHVNLCITEAPDMMPVSIANFVFDDDEVCMFRVKSGVADYDHPLRAPINTPIDTPRGVKEQSPEVTRWIQHLGPNGGVIQEVFRDLLWPIVSGR